MTNYRENLFYGANKEIQERAKCLRRNLTISENILWRKIKNKKLGYKFRRQHPIDIFIADFYCHEKKLVIEVDGEIHNNEQNKEYDINRTAELERFDIKVIRFSNDEVYNYLPEVLNVIKYELSK